MKLFSLFSLAGISIPDGISDVEVTGIVTDSKKVTAGSVFVCIRGLHTDGHNFIKEAVEAGASVIVLEALRDECVGGAATVKVKNTRRVVAELYNAWHGRPADNMKIVGVTGTNGKTSVSYILKKLFEECGFRAGLIGTVGCFSGEKRLDYGSKDSLANMTTPDPEVLYRILGEMAADGVEYVFIEASSHASALSKIDPIYFDTLVYTNLSQDHLDFHGTMENYFLAKANLFTRARTCVINFDDGYAGGILPFCKNSNVVLCSTKDISADYFASNISLCQGVSYSVTSASERFDVRLPSFFGSFSVINSLEAIAVARKYGLPQEKIVSALRKMSGVPGRMERVSLDEKINFSVFIDYAHTPDALEKSILTARGLTDGGRLITLFGCGGERDRGKRRLMGAAASRLSDVVIVTSDNPRSEDRVDILSDIYRGINKEKEHKIIPDRKSAISFAVGMARKNDVILLAGKGHEKYEINETGRHPFDEDMIVREAVNELFF